MAKKKQEQEPAGEQLDLIDVTPENAKKIIPIARAYRKVVAERVELTNKETELKKKILDLVKESKLPRLPDGIIKFKCDGLTIIITPSDDKIKVKEDGEEKEE